MLQALRIRLVGNCAARRSSRRSAGCSPRRPARPRRPRRRRRLAAAQAEAAPESVKLSHDQLDSLVAPIALYPDPLLAQCLVASTYPHRHHRRAAVAGQEHAPSRARRSTKAAEQQDWDPSVQALVSLPDALKRPERKHQVDRRTSATRSSRSRATSWTPSSACAKKAKDKGKLESSEQQKVETKVVESRRPSSDPALEPRGHLRPVLQPDGRLAAAGLPLLPDVLPAVLRRRRARRLRRRNRHRHRDSRRLGLGLRLGRRQQHDQHQQQQQLRQPQQRREQLSNRSGNSNWQHNAAAARRRAVQGQGHGQQVRRQRAGRLGVVEAGRQAQPAPGAGHRTGAARAAAAEREQLRPRRRGAAASAAAASSAIGPAAATSSPSSRSGGSSARSAAAGSSCSGSWLRGRRARAAPRAWAARRRRRRRRRRTAAVGRGRT